MIATSALDPKYSSKDGIGQDSIKDYRKKDRLRGFSKVLTKGSVDVGSFGLVFETDIRRYFACRPLIPIDVKNSNFREWLIVENLPYDLHIHEDGEVTFSLGLNEKLAPILNTIKFVYSKALPRGSK